MQLFRKSSLALVASFLTLSLGASAAHAEKGRSSARIAANAKEKPSAIRDEQADAKVVIALTTGDLQKVRGHLLTGIAGMAKHYREQGKKLSAVVVIYGEAYRFFLKDLAGTPFANDTAVKAAQAELRKDLEALSRDFGVRFEVCQAGMNKRGLSTANVYDFVHVTPNALWSVIEWQQRGYSYLSIGG